MIKRKTRGADSAQHRIPQRLPVIEIGRIGSFEHQPVKRNHLQQSAIAQRHRLGVDMVRIGQMHASGRFGASFGGNWPQ